MSKHWTSLSNLWKRYKYRFVPWIVFNVKTSKRSSPVMLSKVQEFSKPVEKAPFDILLISQMEDKIFTDSDLAQSLTLLLGKFKYNWDVNRTYYNQADIYFYNLHIMKDCLGFSLRTGTSRVNPDAGLGVFVASGTVKKGSIVALYPGTIYKAYEPLFFPSINNSFIFRCSDGIHIDGKSNGISKSIYKSCAARDKFNFDLPCCDESWLGPYPVNPLSIGQYVNNKGGPGNNVVYQECFLPLPSKDPMKMNESVSLPFWKYLPNVWADSNNNTGLKIIALVAVKNIEEDEELLSSYFTVVQTS